MSEYKPKPENKDRTPLYIAIVGATATIAAALIVTAPALLNRAAAPAPTTIVITATPVSTQVSPATAVPPTAVPATLAPPPAVAGRIDFLVSNNREAPYDFYIDDEYQITVPAGGYQLLRVIPGEHDLTHCPRGERPADVDTGCETVAREVAQEPYDWELGGSLPARDEVLLFLLNQIDHDVDVYVDGTEMVSVDAHKIETIQLEPGTHHVQSCPRGATPAQGACGQSSPFEFPRNVEMYVVNVP